MREAKERAGALVPEYHRATPECPEPQRWSMIDSMTAEVEVLEFIATLVTTIKPRLVVETGSFLGVSTEWIARGLERNDQQRNGPMPSGQAAKVISCEYDPVVFAKAQEQVKHAFTAGWVHAARRFIEQKDRRIMHQRLRELEPLLHASRVFLEFAVTRIAQIEIGQHFMRTA